MQRRSTAASRHFVCTSTLALLLVLPLAALGPMPGLTSGWPVFHFNIAAAASASQGGVWTDWPRVLLFVWVGGSVLFVLRAIAGWCMIAQKSRKFAPVNDAAWFADIASAAADLGISDTRVRLRQGEVASPAACGLFSHTILLPHDAGNWDSFRRRTILIHEFAHIRRNDCLWLQIASIACAFFWFHPLAWRLAARLAREQELACDDLALGCGIDCRSYAALLLEAAQDISSRSLLPCAFHGGYPAKHLRVRFANVLEAPVKNHSRRHWRKAFAIVLTCFALSLSSVSLARAEHIYRIGKDVKAPKLISKVEPKYTFAARKAKIQGSVALLTIIGKDGRTRDIHVTRSLDRGLDANAVKAIRQWRFSPAMRNGKPVPVLANIEVDFRLK